MAVQVRLNIDTTPFVHHGVPASVDNATIAQDATRTAALARYTLMGKRLAAAGTPVAGGSNTGNGTVTAFALSGVGTPKVGNYAFTCITAVANGGIFNLIDPDSNIVAQVALNAGAGATTVVIAGGLEFTVTDGSTDFAAADTFTLPVTSVSNAWLPYDPAAVDGVNIPAGIYMGDTIAAATIVAGTVTDNPIITGGYVFVDEDQIVIENSATLDGTIVPGGGTIRTELMKLGIIPEATVAISEFENA